MTSASWRNVWITGASTGIGAALARRLDTHVPHVALSARSQDKIDALCATGTTLRSYPLDVVDADATRQVVAAIGASGGPIDLAVLNAGTWALQDAPEFTLEAVRRGLDVNVNGVYNGLHAVLPSMLERGAGHIAIVASVAGYRGLPRSIAYAPTKAALINLAEILRLELAPKGITVSVVNPGFVDTPMTEQNDFDMPGLISAEVAAEAMEKGLRAGRYEVSFPFGFTLMMKVLRVLPHWLYFWLAKRLVPKG